MQRRQRLEEETNQIKELESKISKLNYFLKNANNMLSSFVATYDEDVIFIFNLFFNFY